MKMKHRAGVVCLLAVLTCLTGCGGSGSSDATAPGVDDKSTATVPPVKAKPDPDPETLAGLPQPVLTDTARYSYRARTDAAVKKLLASRGYDQLEKMGLELLSSREQFTTGLWRLDGFADTLSLLGRDADEKDILARLARLKQWVKARPSSQFAVVALAECQAAHAWKQRGKDWIKDVPAPKWQSFAREIKEAQATLEKAAQFRDQYPRWFTAASSIALGQGWERSRFEELYSTAVEKNKQYNALYYEKALYLTPRWYGKDGDWEAFATSVADAVGGDEGDVLYTRIVWSIVRQHVYEHGELFERASPSWPRIVKGFEVMLKTYRNSPDVLNEYLRLSMEADDVLRARELFKQIGEKATRDTWHEDTDAFINARRWAFGVPAGKEGSGKESKQQAPGGH